jgi:hypothetical protein
MIKKLISSRANVEMISPLISLLLDHIEMADAIGFLCPLLNDYKGLTISQILLTHQTFPSLSKSLIYNLFAMTFRSEFLCNRDYLFMRYIDIGKIDETACDCLEMIHLEE